MWQSIITFLVNHTPLLYLTQSLWRDEAFSVWIARDGFAEIIRRTSGDFNPPLYYIFLHFWMQIFGRSEVALRSLSVVFFILFLVATYKFARTVFKTHYNAKITTLLMALNPMLLYFAFELRMYSLLVLLVTSSMYFFYTKQWKWYVLVTTLGMYTQPFMAFVILAQSLYLLITRCIKQALINGMSILFLYLPWIPTLLTQFRASGPMWMYPVDLITITSVLGNVFFGYEGTPGDLWWLMQLFSVVFIGIIIWLAKRKQMRPKLLLFVTWIFVPLTTVVLISLIKPIYVHRYVIFTTVGEVFLVSFFLQSLPSKKLQTYLKTGIIICLTIINLSVISFHRKVDLQTPFEDIRTQLQPNDVVYAKTPLVFYEALYYTPETTRVFLYNPAGITPPRFVGSVGMPKEVWAKNYPLFPKRAFVVYEDGTYDVQSVLTKTNALSR